YAASAEAMQATSLAPMLELEAFLSVFTSQFKLPYNREWYIMGLDPEAPDFAQKLAEIMENQPDVETVEMYREIIRHGIEAGIPVQKPNVSADDFFPEKNWDVMAISGYMCPDPYSGAAGIRKVGEDIYQATVRQATPRADKQITFTFRLMETLEQSRLVFSPLLNRFLYGEDYEQRPVKISDSGRIRNELQTLCSEALEFLGEERILLHFSRILPDVISLEQQEKLKDILRWYKKHHPLWFGWLEMAD
ncbi:MAG: hypothetical protein KAH24_07460, partial [Holophagae bacterium]|nr:hypothetical protein [Holophagae bacterium]